MDVSVKSRSNQTPLMLAAYNGNIVISKYLMDQGADVNCIDNFSWSPLIYALKN